MSFLIDQFLAFDAEPGDVFAGAVDPTRIGDVGPFLRRLHDASRSPAGPTALGTFTDPRVRAILPQAPGGRLFTDAFFRRSPSRR